MKRWFLTLSPPLFSFLPRKILHKTRIVCYSQFFSISSFFFCSESKNFTKKQIQIQPNKSKQVWMYFLPSSYSSTCIKGIKTEFERYSIIFHKKIWKLCTLVHPCQAFPSLQSHIKILYGSWKCYASRSFKTILYFFIYLTNCLFLFANVTDYFTEYQSVYIVVRMRSRSQMCGVELVPLGGFNDQKLKNIVHDLKF